MRFNLQERDQAIAVLIAILREMGPLEPHVLIDTAAERTDVGKSAVLGGWHHLLDTEVIRWNDDGRAHMSDSDVAQESGPRIAMRRMRDHFARNPEAIMPAELLRILTDDGVIDWNDVAYAENRLFDSGEVGFRRSGDELMLAPGPRAKQPAAA